MELPIRVITDNKTQIPTLLTLTQREWDACFQLIYWHFPRLVVFVFHLTCCKQPPSPFLGIWKTPTKHFWGAQQKKGCKICVTSICVCVWMALLSPRAQKYRHEGVVSSSSKERKPENKCELSTGKKGFYWLVPLRGDLECVLFASNWLD